MIWLPIETNSLNKWLMVKNNQKKVQLKSKFNDYTTFQRVHWMILKFILKTAASKFEYID